MSASGSERSAAQHRIARPLAASAASAEEIAARLQAALASPARSAESRARDASRHPAETLRCFGIEPGMQVLELRPGGGFHDQWYREAFRVPKPGGVFGAVQHRAPEGADVETSAENGYVPEAYVIAAAERAGFELAARSGLDANPRDTEDDAKGVWALPPNFGLGDEDRARYEAIGGSDRMTLRFVKPVPNESAAET